MNERLSGPQTNDMMFCKIIIIVPDCIKERSCVPIESGRKNENKAKKKGGGERKKERERERE